MTVKTTTKRKPRKPRTNDGDDAPTYEALAVHGLAHHGKVVAAVTASLLKIAEECGRVGVQPTVRLENIAKLAGEVLALCEQELTETDDAVRAVRAALDERKELLIKTIERLTAKAQEA